MSSPIYELVISRFGDRNKIQMETGKIYAVRKSTGISKLQKIKNSRGLSTGGIGTLEDIRERRKDVTNQV